MLCQISPVTPMVTPANARLMSDLMQLLEPPPHMGTREWANSRRYLSPLESAMPGKYSTRITPYVDEMLDVLDDPAYDMVVCMKSAQIAWTAGVINNYIGRRIDIDSCPMIAMFAKESAAKEFVEEKLMPMVSATPTLQGKVVQTYGKRDGNKALFKKFPGGFLKLVGSNSPASVKSTPVPVVIVEEPDDANRDVKGQGNTIKLLMERTKTFYRRKIIYGGTPTIKGLSEVEFAYARSDQRKFWVPCHHCGEAHVLSFDHLHCPEDAPHAHEVYGRHRPEATVYACPHCGGWWSDNERVSNIRHGCWQKSAESTIAGFWVNELYSPFPGSRHAELMRKWLEAKHKAAVGEMGDLIAFVNSSMGVPYEYLSDAPKTDELAARALDYDEKTVPPGALLLTAGVDVQGNRLAIIIRGWGRGEESWLIYWGEIYGAPADRTDAVWRDLEAILFSRYRCANGADLALSAASIDSSDGNTNDAVYEFVRRVRNRLSYGVMAIKGASEDLGKTEIFSKPRESIDTNRQNTKAARYGLRPHIVGTVRAKDLIDARLKLTGGGPGRMHWYRGVRADYYEQLTSEVKAPSRTHRHRKVWQKKAGVPNDGLDGEIYALHAARACKVHLFKDADWQILERRLTEIDLFTPPGAEPPARRAFGGARVRS